MNTLSWLLYLSEVVGRIGNVTAAIAVFGGIAGLFLFVIGRIIPWTDWSWDNEETKKNKLDAREKAGNVGRSLIFIAAISLAITAVTPSKQTIYLIAASEAGEVVVKSDEAKEIMSGLRDIIKDQISKNLPTTAKD
ncbi:hypothetical protein [Brucella anthropi]|uniref:hypothetical protein n=1 Tax=Brucella anthropi TaxID=529 RepID=UPI00320865C0